MIDRGTTKGKVLSLNTSASIENFSKKRLKTVEGKILKLFNGCES